MIQSISSTQKKTKINYQKYLGHKPIRGVGWCINWYRNGLYFKNVSINWRYKVTQEIVDIIIIGGGPVGLFTAFTRAYVKRLLKL